VNKKHVNRWIPEVWRTLVTNTHIRGEVEPNEWQAEVIKQAKACHQQEELVEAILQVGRHAKVLIQGPAPGGDPQAKFMPMKLGFTQQMLEGRQRLKAWHIVWCSLQGMELRKAKDGIYFVPGGTGGAAARMYLESEWLDMMRASNSDCPHQRQMIDEMDQVGHPNR
jgi:hypothetical protein